MTIAIPVPAGNTMTDVLRAHAEHRPNQVAYRFLGDGEHVTATMTYAELDVLAKSVARTLHEQCDAQQRIILAHTPGLDFIIDLMGCLYAGMVAVPVYPPAGHREIATADAVIRAARPVAVLSDQPALASALSDAAGVPALTPPARATELVTEWAPPKLGRQSLALLQFTSGSTGTPRGVRVQHRNLLANQARMRAAYHQNADSVVVSWLPFYHDMGLIGSVLHSLYLGASCVLMSPLAFLQEPIRWLRAISEFGGTISPAPDFAYALCTRRISRAQAATLDLRSWQVAINGGEPVRAHTVRSFSEHFAPAGFDPRAMVASYGLAEATLLVAADDPRRECHVLHSADGRELVSCGLVPEGIIVVDAQGHPVAAGEVGEICVTGASVADGYWEQPDLSVETFDWPVDGVRFLRTGDLGFVGGGELWISGRAKDVLVIRGRNHYPQDIEATVEAAAPAIRPGCVAAFLDGERLVVVAETRDDTADPSIVWAVRAAVSRRHGLSAEVVLVRRNKIPKTSSGKIRRRACREAFEAGQLKPLSSSGASDAEVREALTSVLGADKRTIPPDRSIAELGVDSLQAVALQHELQRRLGIDVTLEELLDHTTVADLAAATRQWPQPPPTAAAPRLMSATVGQQALWLLHQLDPSGHRYLIRRALRVEGDLDVAALRGAVRDVARRHPALRARVMVNDGHVGFDCTGPVPSLTVRDADDCVECAAGLAAEQIDLTTGPPVRFTLIRSESEEPVLLVVVHHIVADLWSLSLLLTELLDRYSWHCAHPDATTTDAAPAPTMAHIVQSEREVLDGPAGAALRDRWTKLLADAGTTRSPLPVDRAEPPRTWAADQVVVRFEASLADEVRRTAAALSATPFAVLLSAYCLLLCRSGNTTDVVVGVPTAVRPDPRSAEVIGYCVNTLPVPVRVPLIGRVDQFIGQVARTLRHVLALRAYPLALIAETSGTNPDNRASLFSTMFGMTSEPNGQLPGFSALAANDPTRCLDTGDLKLIAVPLPNAVAQAELDVNVADVDDGFQLTASYATESFDRATVEALAQRFLRWLPRWCSGPQHS
jgi:acyl-CoA synthetase (AMP-forming)/AMP-acid ligase II/aryl carrier-like protein